MKQVRSCCCCIPMSLLWAGWLPSFFLLCLIALLDCCCCCNSLLLSGPPPLHFKLWRELFYSANNKGGAWFTNPYTYPKCQKEVRKKYPPLLTPDSYSWCLSEQIKIFLKILANLVYLPFPEKSCF